MSGRQEAEDGEGNESGNEGDTNTEGGMLAPVAATIDNIESNIKSQGFKILDALSETGLRAIRYAKEIPFVTTIVANELSPQSFN